MNKVRLSVDLDLDNPMDKMIYDYLEKPMENGKKRVKSKWFRSLAFQYINGNTLKLEESQQKQEPELDISDIDDDGMAF